MEIELEKKDDGVDQIFGRLFNSSYDWGSDGSNIARWRSSVPNRFQSLRIRLLSCLKCLAVAVVLFQISATFVISEAQEAFRVGFREDAPPFAYRLDSIQSDDTGLGNAYGGFAIEICKEIVQAIADETGAAFSEFPVNANNRFVQNSGELQEFDLLCDTTSISRERLKYCSFSFPYFVTGISFATEKENAQISDLSGKKIGLVGGTTAEERLATEWMRRFQDVPNLKLFEDYSEGTKAVNAGSIEILFGDQILLQSAAEQSSAPMYVSNELISTELYAFCVNPTRPSLLRLANRTLVEFFTDGRIYGLLSKHFDGQGASRLLIMLYAFYAIPEK